MNPNWARDAFTETNAAIALLGAVLAVAAVVSASFGRGLTAAWLVAAALACLAGVLLLMYMKAATERDAGAVLGPDAPALDSDTEADTEADVEPVGADRELAAQPT